MTQLFRELGRKGSCVCNTIRKLLRVVSVFFILYLDFLLPLLASPTETIFTLRMIKVVNPEQARWVNLSHSGNQSDRRFRFMLPAIDMIH